MRYFLLFTAILLLASSVVAAPEELDDRWVYYGDTWERDGSIYYVDRASSIEKLLLYVDDSPYILNDDECKENPAKSEKYCIVTAAYKDPTKYKDKIKYEHGDELFAYNIITYTLVPELTVTRSISPSSAQFGERSTITVTLHNEGEKPISNIQYSENISESMTLFAIDGTKSGNKIVYSRSSLAAGSKHVFQYAVTPKEYVSETLTPTITYNYESLKKSTTANAITLSISSPVSISRTLSLATAGVNEKATYSITIDNDATDTLVYDVTIELPEGIVLDSQGAFMQSGGDLKKENQIKKNEDDTLEFSFHAPRTGEYPFTVTLNAHVNGKKITRYYYEKLSVTAEQLDPRMLFSRVNNRITSGETATLRIYLKNNDDKNSYVNIDGKLTSDFVTTKISAQSVAPGEDKLIKEMLIVAPQVEEQTNKVLDLSGTYKTSEGEEFDFSKKLTIAVLPDTDLFTISQQANSTRAVPGEAIKITIKVKNDAGRYVFTNIHDSLSESFPIISGTNFAEISLDEGEERQVYLYVFEIPQDFEGSNVTITTSAYEEQLGITQEESLVISVGDEVVVENSPDEVTENDEPQADAPIANEEQGFFANAWDWLVGFFS